MGLIVPFSYASYDLILDGVSAEKAVIHTDYGDVIPSYFFAPITALSLQNGGNESVYSFLVHLPRPSLTISRRRVTKRRSPLRPSNLKLSGSELCSLKQGILSDACVSAAAEA